MDSPLALNKKLSISSEAEKKEIISSISKDKMSEWMSSPNWKTRNLSVKIAGETGLVEYIDDLIRFLTDRTPASIIDRIFGGDFIQVGFIRRNAADSLGKIGHASERVKDALIAAFTDPYWEVRTASIRSYTLIYRENTSNSGIDSIREMLNDKKFEVVSEAVSALGQLAVTRDIIESFRKFYSHPNSRVKVAVVKSLKTMRARGLIKDDKELIAELRNIFIPGNYQISE